MATTYEIPDWARTMTPSELYQEAMDYEEGARYDDVRERYHAELKDLELEAEAAEWEARMDWLDSLTPEERQEEAHWEAMLARAEEVAR